MSPTFDGGPAFPVYDDTHMYPTHTAMTLRDWFAANASEQDIQDFLPQDRREECAFKKEHGFWPDRRWARYRHADAMIAARDIKKIGAEKQ